MTTIVMPASHPVATSFSIAGFRDVDAAADKDSFIAFLDSFAEVFRTMTKDSVDLLHLRPGDAVLDVGCGHGSCIPLLAERVGPSGRIVGLDASRVMIDEARRRFDGRGLPVKFQTGDALALPFRNEEFDATRLDRVLMFLNDPGKALSELVRVTKPGGRIVITEGDMGSHSIDAADVVTTRTILTALCERSPSSGIGRRLRAMFLEAGLLEVDITPVPIVTTSFAEWNHRLGVESIVCDAIAEGKLQLDAAHAWLDDLRTRDARGHFTGIALLYLVAGTRPASCVTPAAQ